jgi:Tfp pilus assembly protein PilP
MRERSEMRRVIQQVLLLATLLICVSALASAQETGAGTPAPSGSAAETATKAPEPAVTSGAYTYNAAGRRDPFVSLLLGRTIGARTKKPGLQGMLISEVVLTGIAKDSQGYIAMVSGSDSKTYFVRIGAELADGKIISITQNKVIFREEIKDPFSTKPFRDIVKSLTPGEGEEENR